MVEISFDPGRLVIWFVICLLCLEAFEHLFRLVLRRYKRDYLTPGHCVLSLILSVVIIALLYIYSL